jgi:hypothetical protein
VVGRYAVLVAITEQRDLYGVMHDVIEDVQGKVGVMRFAVRSPVRL